MEILKRNIDGELLISIVLIISIFAVFYGNSGFSLILNERASLIALIYLAIGLFGLVFNFKKVMFTGLALSAFTSLYLKSASNISVKLPELDHQKLSFSVEHFNLSSADNFEEVLDKIWSTTPDVLSFQELTPDWNQELKSALSEKYPYNYTAVRIDYFGKSVYSKYPILDAEKVEIENINDLILHLDIDGQDCMLISTYVIPSLDKISEQKAADQLNYLAEIMNATTVKNKIVVGEFNMVYWNESIRKFVNNTKLLNSRREAPINGDMPYEHIFYNQNLECTFFQEIKDDVNDKIGIHGVYQTVEKVMIGSL
ncbi:MAG TPA: hypothetical protein PK147_04505 [Saprospiraceae bacterium]|nr:endonuclease/exonuclease/phosphatase family protein [Saprospiraceae bacterium]MCB9327091.1 endonuclease/exonuclease/phosphatase family protein [Lewinellaceae bacterium]HPK08789.1 hypothetical protein [Saprospiraceae bacterium]HPQ21087.1 hypothetical protein [Saprospiraceae bacterium]HRX28965.1 hypothetical protein [Saprospiraceae bacterium]